MKKLTLEDLKLLRDGLRIPSATSSSRPTRTCRPTTTPARTTRSSSTCASAARRWAARCRSAGSRGQSLKLPEATSYDVAKRGSGKQPVATTMAFVRLLRDLMRDKEFGPRVVPIIPDEARTFGMDSFFPTVEDLQPARPALHVRRPRAMLAYKESASGQILHLGINEAGSAAAFTAAGIVVRHPRRADGADLHLLLDVRLPADRRRAVGGRRPDGPRLPDRGDRRPHDADRRGPAARGRALPAARRHEPGRGRLRPGVRATRSGTSCATACGACTASRRRTSTTTSPSTTSRYVQPAEPEGLDVEGVLRGMYLLRPGDLTDGDRPRGQILASGVGGAVGAGGAAPAARRLGRRRRRLERDELERAAPRRPALRRAGVRSSPDGAPPCRTSPSGWRTHPARWSPCQRLHAPGAGPDPRPGSRATTPSLGADGFGFSDTRPAARRFFLVDGPSIATRLLLQLAERGEIDPSVPGQADREVPAARRGRRHDGLHRRRGLTPSSAAIMQSRAIMTLAVIARTFP